jgi:hypothetical protein
MARAPRLSRFDDHPSKCATNALKRLIRLLAQQIASEECAGARCGQKDRTHGENEGSRTDPCE